MTKQHSITPPPELIEQWMQSHSTKYDLARQAAQWGADQELEACCNVLEGLDYDEAMAVSGDSLRDARRPKPPSLKEQALLAIDTAVADDRLSADVASVVRRALEALPE